MPDNTIPSYRRLTPKFVGASLFLSLIPLIFLYFIASSNASQMLIESLRGDLKEKSFLVGANIDQFFNERYHDVRILSQADVLEAENTNAIIKYLTEIIEETPYLDDIDVIDIDGIIIASSGVQNEKGMHVIAQHPTLKSLFNDVRVAKQGEVFVSGILDLDSGPGLAFLTPITDDTNTTVIKILLVEINLDFVSRIVADFDDSVIGDRYVYLVDNDGRVLVSADPETNYFSPFPDLTVKPELLESFSQQGSVGSLTYLDAKGEEVMAGFADMAEFGVNKAMDWSIIAVAPIAEITRPVNAFQNVLLIYTVTVCSIVLLLMYLGARTINQTLDTLALSEQKILDRTNQLENANAELEAFAYSVSHDLRAPLRSMDGFSQALIEDYGDRLDGDAKNYLNRISNASQRMGQMIDDILTLSRASRQEKLTEVVDLSALAHTILADMSAREPDRSVTIEIAPNVTGHGDPRLLQVVLDNLLGNAWKFTSRKETARIEFGVQWKDGERVYFVRDDGAGFDMAYAHKLFGIFQRLHSTTEFEGTGVGLATVARLIYRHGGRVWAEGEENKGASVYFTLED